MTRIAPMTWKAKDFFFSQIVTFPIRVRGVVRPTRARRTSRSRLSTEHPSLTPCSPRSRPTLCSRPASRRERAGARLGCLAMRIRASDRTVHGVINNVVPVSSVSLSVPRRGALFSAALAAAGAVRDAARVRGAQEARAPGDTDQREAAARDEKAARAPRFPSRSCAWTSRT